MGHLVHCFIPAGLWVRVLQKLVGPVFPPLHVRDAAAIRFSREPSIRLVLVPAIRGPGWPAGPCCPRAARANSAIRPAPSPPGGAIIALPGDSSWAVPI